MFKCSSPVSKNIQWRHAYKCGNGCVNCSHLLSNLVAVHQLKFVSDRQPLLEAEHRNRLSEKPLFSYGAVRMARAPLLHCDF